MKSKPTNKSGKTSREQTPRPKSQKDNLLSLEQKSDYEVGDMEEIRAKTIKGLFENQAIAQEILTKRLQRIREHQEVLHNLEKKY